MAIGFFVAWGPYATLAIVKITCAIKGTNMSFLQSDYAFMPPLMAKSSVIYNPIIYAVFNTQVVFSTNTYCNSAFKSNPKKKIS